MKFAVAFLAAVAAAAPAHAAFTDDFNRADGGLGPNYTVHYNGLSISGNRVIATNFVPLATLNGSSSTASGIDVALRGLDAGSYVALTFGYDPANEANSYFIKVQDDNGDGFFDKYGFGVGNNDIDVINGLSPFQAGTIDVSYEGTLATLMVTVGNTVETFTHNYNFAPGSTVTGLALNRQGAGDNFRTNLVVAPGIPEPGTWAMMLTGFGLAGAALRSRRRRAAATA